MKQSAMFKKAHEYAARGVAFDLYWTCINGWVCRKKKVQPAKEDAKG